MEHGEYFIRVPPVVFVDGDNVHLEFTSGGNDILICMSKRAARDMFDIGFAKLAEHDRANARIVPIRGKRRG